MNNNWCNTLLVAYSSLQKIISNLDSGVKARVKSAFGGQHLKNGVTNEQLVAEIIELNDEKRKIVNLYYITNTALKQLTPQEFLIVDEHINKKKTFLQISEENNIPMRTLFRRLDSAEKHFAALVNRMGYGDEWLEKEYGKDKYISAIHYRLADEKYFLSKSARG